MPEARVAFTHDLADGEMKTVTVGDTEVLLSRVDGAFHACGAHCTHYGAPLADGALHGRMVTCPWHHAQFDVTDGALLDAPALDGLARYRVRIDGEHVFVRVPDDAEETPEGAAYRESGGETPDMADRDFDEHPQTFVIVGGGAAGEMAAETLREAGFEGRVVMITKEDAAPYDRTQLSKGYLGGAAGDDALPLRDDAFYERHGVEILRGLTVTKLDAESKTIHFADAEPLKYDRVLVATGGTPRTLDVPGADLDGIYLLRQWHDAERIVAQAEDAASAVVVGSSFIGMEAAAQLTGRGLDVTVVSTDETPFEAVLGAKVGGVLQRVHEEHGVTFHLGAGVERIEARDGRLAVTTEGGATAEGDFVLVGIGVTPVTDFLSGVTKDDGDGGVIVDDHLTAGDGVFAAGDIAHFPEPHSGQRVRIEHWRVAQQHGRVAARNMAGASEPYRGVPFFWSGQFGVNLRYVGHAESWDEVHIDGSLDDKQFIAYYLKGGDVRAAAGIGRDREVAALHALMLATQTPSADEVKSGIDLLARLKD
jgi:NADPH-dependent 2,4-dienoyl-CoA reductase/sulfur reductase-like enzyme/nitrite reductase/ring-hydroxylating ferredoxin subunit